MTWGALQQPAFAALRLKERQESHRPPGTTEVFSKAVDQLGSVKAQICLGGIYTLERISRESRHDHYVVMEVLTAFVRERARWSGQEGVPSTPATSGRQASNDLKSSRREMAKDVAAALAVIIRRENACKGREGSRIDLRGTNLGPVDFAHAPLRKSNLSGTNLIGANLVSANLSGAHMSRANLRGASLIGASLARANLCGADLSLANLRGADLHEADISWADLKDASLYGANLAGATVIEARLGGACLHGANLHRSNFGGSDLSDAQIGGANLSNANLKNANLARSMLSRSNLNETNLYEADFNGADLRAANLSGADLSWVDLSNALLSWADLRGAILYGANLKGADLSGADLRGADIRRVDLSGANMRDAILQGAVREAGFVEETVAASIEPDGTTEAYAVEAADELVPVEADAMESRPELDTAMVQDLISAEVIFLDAVEPYRFPADLRVSARQAQPAWASAPRAG